MLDIIALLLDYQLALPVVLEASLGQLDCLHVAHVQLEVSLVRLAQSCVTVAQLENMLL